MTEANARIEISALIHYQPAWLSWVGATTMCLQALEVDCDAADVAGYSGYAFALAINDPLCPSGPSSVDWTSLDIGPLQLGRSTLNFLTGDCHTAKTRCQRTSAHCRHAFEIVRREVGANRPCVIWGAGLPEFGVVRGVEGEDYLCVEGGPTPARVRFDELNAPGGPYILAFPTEVKVDRGRDLAALVRAVDRLSKRDEGPGQKRGLSAYDAWAETLQAKRALRLGNSYNAQCWAEARGYAERFLGRLAQRYPTAVRIALARDAFAEVAALLRAVADLFPFTTEEGLVEDRQVLEPACEHLRQAREAEARGLARLEEALAAFTQLAEQQSH
ncbi:MAG: hypothetical protein ACF8NJ_10480 [Phycisphaerales bacterium JB038]